MEQATVARIARAVLYEGFVLYPYRHTSLKNARPVTFGTLYPRSWLNSGSGADRSWFQMECLLQTGEDACGVSVTVRFLELAGAGEASEREARLDATLTEVIAETLHSGFSFPPLAGEISLRAVPVAPDLWKLWLAVRNTTATAVSDGETALRYSLVSAHAAVVARGGQFVSMTAPPENLSGAAAGCVNVGVWPVLVGDPVERSTLLASPIILPDFPQVAPESPGDLCDATEIDEILTLRILTLTEEEKAEARSSGEHARGILERAETLPAEHLMRLHGVLRDFAPRPVDGVQVQGRQLKAGDRVRLRPGKRADIFDTALEGRTAVIDSVEQDFENRVHVAVVVEDDPGRDLGAIRQIGHRFFFDASELEPLEAAS